MVKRYLSSFLISLAMVSIWGLWMAAQTDDTRFHVVVNLVQLNVAVTDGKGNYVTGLKPTDFSITEDGITEKIATFAEGNAPTRRVYEVAQQAEDKSPRGDSEPPSSRSDSLLAQETPAPESQDSLSSAIAGANVF